MEVNLKIVVRDKCFYRILETSDLETSNVSKIYCQQMLAVSAMMSAEEDIVEMSEGWSRVEELCSIYNFDLIIGDEEIINFILADQISKNKIYLSNTRVPRHTSISERRRGLVR